jgi:hypothetical protein
MCTLAKGVKVMCKYFRVFGCDLNPYFQYFFFNLHEQTLIYLIERYSFFEILVTIYCNIDRESNYVLGREWALLLSMLPITRFLTKLVLTMLNMNIN